VSGDPTFRDLMARAREAMLGAYAHQDVPFPFVLRDLFANQPLSRTLISRVVLNLLSFSGALPGGQVELPDISLEAFTLVEEHAKYDLMFIFREGREQVTFKLIGAADLFDRSTVTDIQRDYEDLLRQAVAAPDTPLSRLLPKPRRGGGRGELTVPEG
jgi:non-ribosomal peptide synthetase component F